MFFFFLYPSVKQFTPIYCFNRATYFIPYSSHCYFSLSLSLSLSFSISIYLSLSLSFLFYTIFISTHDEYTSVDYVSPLLSKRKKKKRKKREKKEKKKKKTLRIFEFNAYLKIDDAAHILVKTFLPATRSRRIKIGVVYICIYISRLYFQPMNLPTVLFTTTLSINHSRKREMSFAIVSILPPPPLLDFKSNTSLLTLASFPFPPFSLLFRFVSVQIPPLPPMSKKG